MQVPKAALRQRILAAAQNEFLENGFKKASMRDIAQLAGVTTGNIYSYFPSKEALYLQIVSPVIERIHHMLQVNVLSAGVDNTLQFIFEQLLILFRQNRPAFLILLTKSEGAPYADILQQLKENSMEIIRDTIFPHIGEELRDPLLARAWSSAIIEGLLTLFLHNDDDQQLPRRLDQFLRQMLPKEALLP